jgi:hypothetical protein
MKAWWAEWMRGGSLQDASARSSGIRFSTRASRVHFIVFDDDAAGSKQERVK